MKKMLSVLALLAVAVIATAQGDKPDRQDIDVTVVGGKATVTEEIARTTDRHGALVWKVQRGFRFADADGIDIEAKGKQRFKCEARENGSRFRCAKLGHIKGEQYKYVVNLIDANTNQRLVPLDPYIAND